MPTTAPVMSKRVGAPRKKNSQKPAPEVDKKNSIGTQSKRKPQGGQGSDTDSGIYQVKSHTIIQRRQPPPKFNRTARDTYFDKVLNNSEDSNEGSVENDGFYICEDCKMDDDYYICRKCKMNAVDHRKQSPPPQRHNKQEQNGGRFSYSRKPQYASRSRRNRSRDEYYDENEDESLTEDETSSPQRRPSGRQPSKPNRNASLQRQRQQKPHPKPEVSDRSQNTKTVKQTGPRLSQRDSRREPPRARREPEYSDFDSNEDEQNSEISVEMQPRRRSVHNDAPTRRGKQQYREVVERRTTTRLSRQNDDDARIRRMRVADNYSSESWTEASEQSENSEDTYEHIEVQRHNSRRQNRKVYTTYLEHPQTHIVEIYEYEDDESARPQGRRVRPRSKTQGPSNGSLGRRMSTNAEPKMRSSGVRVANART
nr:expressed conserved protein [Hymenolepis microstoma]